MNICNPNSKKERIAIFILELKKFHFEISGKEIKEEQLKNKPVK